MALELALDDRSVIEYLESDDPAVLDEILNTAEEYRLSELGNEVYMRGLIEFSNQCTQNCLYCGLRRDNSGLHRYSMGDSSILELAEQAYNTGYQSIALQSGDLAGELEAVWLVELVKKIKEIASKYGGEELGITLSVGELSWKQYHRLREAGADRYLLRVESSNPVLFRSIHPPQQSYERRLECLAALKDNDYQLGTGIMVGIPGQSTRDLLEDLHFFQSWDIDMLGLGPYIPHPNTPLARSKRKITIDPWAGTLKMMALSRLLLKDINMVCSTALQSLGGQGLQLGLKAGANVVMPVMTPIEQRADYSLYANKSFKDLECLQIEVEKAGYRLAYWKQGNSRHYYRVRNQRYPGPESAGPVAAES